MNKPIYYTIQDLEPSVWWIEVIDGKANRYVLCKEQGSEKRHACLTEKATQFFLIGAKQVNITEAQFDALFNLAYEPGSY
jgi:hypothetical protein